MPEALRKERCHELTPPEAASPRAALLPLASKDRHLHIIYSERPLPNDRGNGPESPAERAAHLARSRGLISRRIDDGVQNVCCCHQFTFCRGLERLQLAGHCVYPSGRHGA